LPLAICGRVGLDVPVPVGDLTSAYFAVPIVRFWWLSFLTLEKHAILLNFLAVSKSYVIAYVLAMGDLNIRFRKKAIH
jgi:hypothetical protein